MNIKDKLLEYRHKEQPVSERYMNFIKETIDNTNLTEEQFNFIKDLLIYILFFITFYYLISISIKSFLNSK